VLRHEVAVQPELPGGIEWPVRTVEWWATWGSAPQAEHFGSTDWDFLLDTALLHAAVWGAGKLDWLPELRLRAAKFGATPEDRARLRMTFADADEKDAKRPDVPVSSARERFGHLVSLPQPGADTGS
jgi:hypothetical protein